MKNGMVTTLFLINVVNLCQQLVFKIGDKTDGSVKGVNFFKKFGVVPPVAQVAARNAELGTHGVHEGILGIHAW
jgi:hypothetical protein